VTAENIEFQKSKFSLANEDGESQSYPEEMFASEELLVLGTAELAKDRQIRVRFKMRPTRLVRRTHQIVAVSIVASWLTVIVYASNWVHWISAGNLALILLPTTFAGH
jgi:hypothetical protein